MKEKTVQGPWISKNRKQLKREKFIQLAEKRMTNTIKNMRLVGNLSNKSHYDYTEMDVRKILTTLTKELEALKAKFKDKGSDDDSIFKLR